jgi:hypothetical protein
VAVETLEGRPEIACGLRRKPRRGGTVKAVPPRRGGEPWRAEAHESHAPTADLNRLQSEADSRVERTPEGEGARGARTSVVSAGCFGATWRRCCARAARCFGGERAELGGGGPGRFGGKGRCSRRVARCFGAGRVRRLAGHPTTRGERRRRRRPPAREEQSSEGCNPRSGSGTKQGREARGG